MTLFVILIAIAAGAMTPLQGTNAELFKFWQQPIWTTAWVYLSGFAGIMLIQAFARQALPATQAVHAAPWWAWTGGVLSIITTLVALMFAQKLGSGMFSGLSITATILVSILLDHMGWIGFKQHAASPQRIAGGLLMVGGVWLVSRY
ncbi:MAG: DMT family transporter [Janthinobacterium lividum]